MISPQVLVHACTYNGVIQEESRVAIEVPFLQVNSEIQQFFHDLILFSLNMGGNDHQVWLKHIFDLNYSIY